MVSVLKGLEGSSDLERRYWNFFGARSKRLDVSGAYQVGCHSCSSGGGRRNVGNGDEIIRVSRLGGRVSSEASA